MFLHWNKKLAWAWLTNANNLNDSSGRWESSVLALLQMITVMREWWIEEAEKIKKRWDIEEHTLDETTDGKNSSVVEDSRWKMMVLKNDSTKGKERHIPADETFPFAFVSSQVSTELPTRSQFSHYPDHNTGFWVNAKYVHCKQSQGDWPNHLYNLRPAEQHHLSWEAEGTHLRNGRFVSEEPAVLRELKKSVCAFVYLSLFVSHAPTHLLLTHKLFTLSYMPH